MAEAPDPPKQLHFIIPERLVILLSKHAEVGGLHVDVGGLCKAEQESEVSSLSSRSLIQTSQGQPRSQAPGEILREEAEAP